MAIISLNFYVICFKTRNRGRDEDAVDHEELSSAVETMRSVMEKFKNLDLRKLSSDMRSTKSAASK